MNCHTLLENLHDSLPVIFRCESINEHRCRILTPYLFPNGDYVELFVEETPVGLYLTDLGEVLGYLSDHGISFRQSPKRQKTLNDILLTHGIEHFKGELRVRLDTTANSAAWLVARLGQASVQAANLIYSLRLSSLATFREEVEELWNEIHVPYEANYRVIGGSGENHRVDFYLPQQRPLLVTTLSSSTAGYARILISDVVRVWHDIRRVDGRFHYLSLFDDSADVWRAEWIEQVAQFSDVVNWSNRDQLLTSIQ